ncbi:unnamed protein product, partial [Mycena citricolor]
SSRISTSSSTAATTTSCIPFLSRRPGIDFDFGNGRLALNEETTPVCGLSLAQAPWFFGALTSSQLYDRGNLRRGGNRHEGQSTTI